MEVAPAVHKMYGAVIADRLAFLLPLNLALQHVPNLHLSKAHWCPKKGKASGRPLSDLSNVDGTRINTDETAKAATDYCDPYSCTGTGVRSVRIEDDPIHPIHDLHTSVFICKLTTLLALAPAHHSAFPFALAPCPTDLAAQPIVRPQY